ncbi:MAG: MBOAT family protein [Candidatus Aminicenantes bacterium]|jgi:alginate O-acetyltransferase complex protein AlgI|nr:MBOAT family protein [Candidatus Aminicenantes bacterium]
MLFSTPTFLFLFLPAVLMIGLFLKKEAQNLFLLLASLIFYAWGEGWIVLLLLASALFNHCFGLAIEKGNSSGKRKAWLIAGLGFNLSLLIVFKYAGFILANLEPLLRSAGIVISKNITWHQPLGVSFFTFMAMAYLVEVYNRSCPAENKFLHTALFITFFPTVLAGPINRYSSLRQQLAERETTPELLSQGSRRFIIGLGKKVLLADTLARVADHIFAIPASGLTAPVAWLGAVCYTLQIFFDFSGYSDMAIGLGRMFGFTFMENFKYPYISRSITEFWTRWHISLSTWLRDFLFLPMAYSVSRRIKSNRWLGIKAESWSYYPSMFITMLLCGLWHGAAWTFIAWGVYHGSFIMLERSVLKKFIRRLWTPLQISYALLTVIFGWVLFRADDFSRAAGFWRAMFGFGHGDGLEFYPALYLNNEVLTVLALAILLAAPVGLALAKIFDRLCRTTEVKRLLWLKGGYRLLTTTLLLAVLLASAMRLAMTTYNPFIYFRF